MDVMYLDEPSEDYIESAVKTVMDIHVKVYSIQVTWLKNRNLRATFYFF